MRPPCSAAPALAQLHLVSGEASMEVVFIFHLGVEEKEQVQVPLDLESAMGVHVHGSMILWKYCLKWCVLLAPANKC